MVEEKIVEMIKNGNPWEEVFATLISSSGIDVWNIDIVKMCDVFLGCIRSMEKMDLRIPAQYIILASFLLNMKADFVSFFKDYEKEFEEMLEEGSEKNEDGKDEVLIEINVPIKRKPVRRITLDELIRSLKKVMEMRERKVERERRMRSRINVGHAEDISKRIDSLYMKITMLLSKLKGSGEMVRFSEVVGEWNRENVVNAFIPLLHLDHENRVDCKQKEVFGEIWIKKS